MKIHQHEASRGLIGRILAVLSSVIFLFFPSSAAAKPPKQHLTTLKVARMFVSKGQQFSCTVDYPEPECLRRLSAIRDQLAVYHAEYLGPWTWILVSSATWKPLSEGLGVAFASPAMTSYVDRATLLDESLFAPSRARAFELSEEFHLPLDELVPRTLTHEMGHAYCGDPNEQRTEEAAAQIRRGIRPGCAAFATQSSEKMASRNSGK